MKLRHFSIILLLFFSYAHGQDAEVMTAVRTVFQAMAENDSSLLTSVFVDAPTLYTVVSDKDGQTRLVPGDFQRFADAVGSKKEVTWHEPIWNEKIEIDGSLASVWVDYAFYLGSTFSHCGVDAFHLVKEEGQWKIFHLVDTRRQSNCEIPKEISEAYR